MLVFVLDPEVRHSRENSGCSNRGSTGSHSRQNSRDKGNHSRQNSRELLVNIMPTPTSSPSAKTLPRETSMITIERPPQKNIEIYATLPKSKKGLLSRATKTKNTVEDEEYLMYDRPGRSLSRSKLTGNKKDGEKRARSEERNNKTTKEKEFQSNSLTKESKKQTKVEEPKQNKKQHKIRRKLLMGGLIRRKNRSMPDLREDETAPKDMLKEDPKTISKDDSNIGAKMEKPLGMSGYLSEGHLEFSGNPNLERSKLMRKSFHGSKILQMAKVPPPPPLRTTSQLSKTDRPPFPLPMDDIKQNLMNERNDEWGSREPQSLPYIPASYGETKKIESVTYANGGFLLPDYQQHTRVVTTAQVHQEQSPQQQPRDEVDSGVPCDANGFPLPPYPSPLHSVTHSRQASEDFPPPPPEASIQDPEEAPVRPPSPQSLLAQVQQKRLQILAENEAKAAAAAESYEAARAVGGETWLRELQAKQAALKGKNGYTQSNKTENSIAIGNRISTPTKSLDSIQHYEARDRPICQENVSNNQQATSVRDLKSRFEQAKIEKQTESAPQILTNNKQMRASPIITDNAALFDAQVNNNTIINSQTSTLTYDSSLITAHMNGLNISLDSSRNHDNEITFANGNPVPSKQYFDNHEPRRKSGKKKNVTFCEQVVLVATADEDEVDSYIPNPILERVLRSVLHKDSSQDTVRETTIQSVIPLKRTDSGNYGYRNQENQQNKVTQNQQINGIEKNNSASQEQPTYQSNSSSNLSSNALNDTKHQYLSNTNGENGHQDHSSIVARHLSNQQQTIKSVQQSPVMSRPVINQTPLTRVNSQVGSHQIPHGAPAYNTNHGYPNQTYQQLPQHMPSQQQQQQLQHPQQLPHPQSYPTQLQQQPQHQYSPQSSPGIHSPTYTYPPNPHTNLPENNSSDSQYQPSNHNDSYSSQQHVAVSHVATSSPYQPVPIPQNSSLTHPPYQHVPPLQSHQYPMRPVSSASSVSSSQVHGYSQQSPMLNRQLSHPQISTNDSRKLTVMSNPTSQQQRIAESFNHSQAERYSHQAQSIYNQQAGSTGSLRSQHSTSSEQSSSSRFINNPPIHQHTTVRARPQAMYQQDLPPPEYQHPPPPKKDGIPSNGLPTRSEIYQRVPNPNGSHMESHGPQMINPNLQNGYNHPPSIHGPLSPVSHGPLSPTNHGPLSPNPHSHPSSGSVYQYPPQHAYQQHPSGQSVYHHVPSNLQQPGHHPQTNGHPNQQPIYNHQYNHGQPHQQSQQAGYHSQANGHVQQAHQFQHPNHSASNGQYPNQQYNPNSSSQQPQVRHPTYQPPPHPKQMEAASKMVERTTQPNAINGVRTNPCNLCRKKQVQHPAIYCTDCDFYMSRFKPKT